MPHAAHTDVLPSLLTFADGSAVLTASDWGRRRAEIFSEIIEKEYGGMPKALSTENVSIELISEGSGAPRLVDRGITFREYKVDISGGEKPFSFSLRVWVPAGEGPFPVVINGDGCWSYLTDGVLGDVVRRGFALAAFNRCEFARDWKDARDCGIYTVFPGEYGALSAWAWGYHRVVDAVQKMAFLDREKIAITGHSRGGKTVLLAAATDERIAVVADNDSGCGGAGSFHVEDEKCETIADITGFFPFWFAKDFRDWAGREAELPFDQHFLKALIAPRAMQTQFALGDAWANQPGTEATHAAVMEVYRLLDVEERLRLVYREGEHRHRRADWGTFLDFAERVFLGKLKEDGIS